MSLSVLSPSPSRSSLLHRAAPLRRSRKLDYDEHGSAFRTLDRRCSGKVFCLRTGESKTQKTDRSFFDNASNVLTNLLSAGSIRGMPVAEGAVSDLFDRPLFYALYDWFIEHGPVYKLAFGPKAFVVVSDPVVARHILRENVFGYDKGVLADILEPIMGKGLIPADLDTWKVRRRAIVPGFHAAYLEAMIRVFDDCSERTMQKFDLLLSEAGKDGRQDIEVELESEFSSLALDIIGLSVFNYDFGSVTKESPVIQAVYGTLSEAEHRSTFYIPYWKFPLSKWLVPRQRKFQKDLEVINDCLDSLIRRARHTRQEDDIEALQRRDYSKVKDASLLRFLVDMRGEDADDKQLRDDLMTMLIAGHETTAAVLTWATFMLAQNPAIVAKAQAEIDDVLGGRRPTYDDLKKLQYARCLLASTPEKEYPSWPLKVLAHIGSHYHGSDQRLVTIHEHPPAKSVSTNSELNSGKGSSFSAVLESVRYWMRVCGRMGPEDWQPASSAQQENLPRMKNPVIFSFGVITDVQYADIPDGYSFAGVPRFYRHSLEVLGRAVSHWNRKGNLIFAIHLGDIVDGFCPKPEALEAVTRVVGTFDKFTGSMYHILGNHCFYNLPRADLNRILSISAAQEGLSYYDFCPTNDFRIVVLDGYDISALGWPDDHPHMELANSLLNSKNPNQEKNSPEGLTGTDRRFVKFNGGIGVDQLKWLEDLLQDATFLGQKVIILCHLPLNPEAASPISLLWNYDEVMEAIHRYIRLIVAEALRLYPQPPLLIRRSLRPDTLPGGNKGDPAGYSLPAGTDIFISVYNLHRSPFFWKEPEKFEPERFLENRTSDVAGWDGFDPNRAAGGLYPNEVMADFAFLPFGGGPRKCVGDQFAFMESTVGLAKLLQKYNVQLRGSPEEVELVTGATLHTKNGLWCKLRQRQRIEGSTNAATALTTCERGYTPGVKRSWDEPEENLVAPSIRSL